MRYLVMVLGAQTDYDAMAGKGSAPSPAWTEEDLRAMQAFMDDLNNDLAQSGEWIDGQGLTAPARARHVIAGSDGRPVVSDAPYRDSEAVIAGYWLLDCPSLERVTEIAARITRCPEPRGTRPLPVVIRPVMEGPNDLG